MMHYQNKHSCSPEQLTKLLKKLKNLPNNLRE
jgi:hypothetical protein